MKTSMSVSTTTAALLRQLSSALDRPASELVHEWALRELKERGMKPDAPIGAEVVDGMVVLRIAGSDLVTSPQYAREFAATLKRYGDGTETGKHVDLDVGSGIITERRGSGVVLTHFLTKEASSMSLNAARLFAEQIIETANQA